LMQMCWKKQPQQRPVSSLFLFFHSTQTQTQHLNNLICFFLDWNVDRILKQLVQCLQNKILSTMFEAHEEQRKR
jgi:hypothetical protein